MLLSDETIIQVWNKARKIDGYNPDIFRQDACGAWIVFNKYGLRDNDYGWEIDHVFPSALGGDDDINNLRALHWKNNASKGDDYPSYIARVTSDGTKNVGCYKSFTVNAVLRTFIQRKYIDKF
ncbi:MAG: HNH endonuclease [Bacteroidales bacterium]|nr:HNH endonuclease [Bacteroidales bacterium]